MSLTTSFKCDISDEFLSIIPNKLRRITFTQLGEFTEGPSHPMWATCFTSVGKPICISGSSSSLSVTSLKFLSTSPVEQHINCLPFLHCFISMLNEEFESSLREGNCIPNIWEMYLKPFNRPFILLFDIWSSRHTYRINLGTIKAFVGDDDKLKLQIWNKESKERFFWI